MLGISGGHLVVCGGQTAGLQTDKCEIFDQEQGIWVNGIETFNSGVKGYFPFVQLDNNRIWIGREFSKQIDFT